jgi:hypothetical protein
LNEKLDDTWKRYGFTNLVDQVLAAIDLREEKPDDLTLVAGRCVDIVDAERRRMKRIDDWIERQKSKD